MKLAFLNRRDKLTELTKKKKKKKRKEKKINRGSNMCFHIFSMGLAVERRNFYRRIIL